MINQELKNDMKRAGSIILVGLVSAFILFYKPYKQKSKPEPTIDELKIEVIELRFENKLLLQKIKVYQSQSDSISKIVVQNNKSANAQIKQLIHLSNDALRKIANE